MLGPHRGTGPSTRQHEVPISFAWAHALGRNDLAGTTILGLTTRTDTVGYHNVTNGYTAHILAMVVRYHNSGRTQC